MRLFRSEAGSTQRLVQYSLLYFAFYTLYGTNVKYFQGSVKEGLPGLSEWEFLVYSTLGSAFICIGVILAAGWWRFPWRKKEILLMVLSGTCTAVVIPTTTMMYSLPISVMVAMVLMRGSVILTSRMVDSILLWQRFSNKHVLWAENIAMGFALAAIGLHLFFAHGADFDFLHSSMAMGILGFYILFYAARIYLMNLFKFTREKKSVSNNLNYFAIEQLTASIWIFGTAGIVATKPELFFLTSELKEFALHFHQAIMNPNPQWKAAMLGGVPFGFSAFFSVFLFMFEGRTSTFAGLVNRLTSLIAGTFSTLIFAFAFAGKWPKTIDWLSLLLILISVGFLVLSEKSRKTTSS